MPLTIVRHDITTMDVDAIVNAANTALQMGGGVCGAIFRAAGTEQLRAACEPLAPIAVGEAVVTPGFALPARYVIHTAGPVYHGGHAGEAEQLRSCYLNSLKRAVENRCESVAFPLISSGIYGYPKQEAFHVATETIRDFLDDHEMEVFLVVFDREAFAASETLLGRVASYIDDHYVQSHLYQRRGPLLEVENAAMAGAPVRSPISVAEALKDLDEPFSSALLRLIDAKGTTDVEVYKRANLDRRLFSKIRNSPGYTPSKRTALALAIALELSLDETGDLLQRAGYALSPSSKFDVIVEYFIVNRQYDILEINQVLFAYDQPLLGG